MADIFLFFVAVFGGALNAVAGGGSFICLPALIYVGVPPVSANATCALALWPGSLSSAFGYRRELTTTGRWLTILGVVSLLGGLTGAVLLIRTSDTAFLRLLPWLMLMAATTFTFGGRLPKSGPLRPTVAVALLQLAIAVYGGYFGGGMGIMMLATMTFAGMTDIHEMNALKSVLAVAINGVAIVEFIAAGVVAWQPGVIMVAGAIAGGYLGASFARKLDPRWVRGFIIVVAWSMTVYFFQQNLLTPRPGG